jgi:hypothetical protein
MLGQSADELQSIGATLFSGGAVGTSLGLLTSGVGVLVGQPSIIGFGTNIAKTSLIVSGAGALSYSVGTALELVDDRRGLQSSQTCIPPKPLGQG